jgi:hypothetical protein
VYFENIETEKIVSFYLYIEVFNVGHIGIEKEKLSREINDEVTLIKYHLKKYRNALKACFGITGPFDNQKKSKQ